MEARGHTHAHAHTRTCIRTHAHAYANTQLSEQHCKRQRRSAHTHTHKHTGTHISNNSANTNGDARTNTNTPFKTSDIGHRTSGGRCTPCRSMPAPPPHWQQRPIHCHVLACTGMYWQRTHGVQGLHFTKPLPLPQQLHLHQSPTIRVHSGPRLNVRQKATPTQAQLNAAKQCEPHLLRVPGPRPVPKRGPMRHQVAAGGQHLRGVVIPEAVRVRLLRQHSQRHAQRVQPTLAGLQQDPTRDTMDTPHQGHATPGTRDTRDMPHQGGQQGHIISSQSSEDSKGTSEPAKAASTASTACTVQGKEAGHLPRLRRWMWGHARCSWPQA